MLPGRKFTLNDILGMAVRRKWLIVVPLAAGIIGSQFAARRVPFVYLSETLIQVIPQQVPESIVKSTMTATMEERLPSISEQILSRSRLERIINDFNLYPRQRAQGVMEDVIARMRTDIKGPTLVGKESFRLSYVSSDPKISQKVTERLASLYIEENLRDRQNQAEGTNQFLEAQLADAKRRLLETEKKLADYQRQYSGQLPTQLPTNLQAIQNAQMQLQSASESLNRARERRLLVERQLADAQSSSGAAVLPEGNANAAGPPTTAQQLLAARARLEAYKLQYTPDHPDVRALERTIRDLEARAAEEGSRPSQTTASAPVSPAEAARQKRIRDLTVDMDVIDRQIAALQLEETNLKKTIGAYQSDVNAAPMRQAELVELTRDYTTLQAAYNSLLGKQEDAKLAASLEHRQIGEQFRILDPASLPEKPYNLFLRWGVAAGAVLGGLVLGLALAGFIEYQDSSFKSEEDIVRILQLPVLALVPTLLHERDQRIQHRRKLLGLALAAAVVMLSSVTAFALWRLQ